MISVVPTAHERQPHFPPFHLFTRSPWSLMISQCQATFPSEHSSHFVSHCKSIHSCGPLPEKGVPEQTHGFPHSRKSTPQKHPSYWTNILGGLEEHLASWKKVLGGMTDKNSASEMMDSDSSVAEEAKKRLLATHMTTLLHEIFFCQDQLDEIARRRQPLIIKKRGGYASVSGEFTT